MSGHFAKSLILDVRKSVPFHGLTLGLVRKMGAVQLSEGQMQRIAIARAIFSGRPVLLLDECTSTLDEETEVQLLSNLRALTDKTVLIVTHRPAALKVVDTVADFSESGVNVHHCT